MTRARKFRFYAVLVTLGGLLGALRAPAPRALACPAVAPVASEASPAAPAPVALVAFGAERAEASPAAPAPRGPLSRKGQRLAAFDAESAFIVTRGRETRETLRAIREASGAYLADLKSAGLEAESDEN